MYDHKKRMSLQRQGPGLQCLVSLPEGRQLPQRQCYISLPQGASSKYSDTIAHINASKDCFVIPEENLERFLPDGITVRNTS